MAPDSVVILTSVWIGFGIFGLYALLGLIAGGVQHGGAGGSTAEGGGAARSAAGQAATVGKKGEVAAQLPSTKLPLARLPLVRQPLDTFEVTSFFGPRGSGFHEGIDLDEKKGAAVYAAWKGRVLFAGERRGYGKVVDLAHGEGVVTRYAHLERIAVRKGEAVPRGKVIGAVGNSGVTRGGEDGTHLHFEVRLEGLAVDPLPYLKQSQLR